MNLDGHLKNVKIFCAAGLKMFRRHPYLLIFHLAELFLAKLVNTWQKCDCGSLKPNPKELIMSSMLLPQATKCFDTVSEDSMFFSLGIIDWNNLILRKIHHTFYLVCLVCSLHCIKTISHYLGRNWCEMLFGKDLLKQWGSSLSLK